MGGGHSPDGWSRRLGLIRNEFGGRGAGKGVWTRFGEIRAGFGWDLRLESDLEARPTRAAGRSTATRRVSQRGGFADGSLHE